MIDLDEIAATVGSLPIVLSALLAPIDLEMLRCRPEPGEWSVLEIVGHLIAADAGAFRGRIEAIIAGEAEIAGFDPWAAINAGRFADQSVAQLLTELAAERASAVTFLSSLDPAKLMLSATYPGHGEFTAGDFVHEWPFHDQEHLQQILANLKGRYLPHMSSTMRLALAAN